MFFLPLVLGGKSMFLQGFILGLGILAGVSAGYITYTVFSSWLQGLKMRKEIEKIVKEAYKEAHEYGIKTKTESSD